MGRRLSQTREIHTLLTSTSPGSMGKTTCSHLLKCCCGAPMVRMPHSFGNEPWLSWAYHFHTRGLMQPIILFISIHDFKVILHGCTHRLIKIASSMFPSPSLSLCRCCWFSVQQEEGEKFWMRTFWAYARATFTEITPIILYFKITGLFSRSSLLFL